MAINKMLIEENRGFSIYWYPLEYCYRVFKDGAYFGVKKYRFGEVSTYTACHKIKAVNKISLFNKIKKTCINALNRLLFRARIIRGLIK